MKPIAFSRADANDSLRDQLQRQSPSQPTAESSRQGLRAVQASAPAPAEQAYQQFLQGDALQRVAEPQRRSVAATTTQAWLSEYNAPRLATPAAWAPHPSPSAVATSQEADLAALVHIGSKAEFALVALVSPTQQHNPMDPESSGSLANIKRYTTNPSDQQRLIAHLFAPAPAFLDMLRLLPGLSDRLAALQAAGTSGPSLTKKLDDQAAALISGLAAVDLDRSCWYFGDFGQRSDAVLDGARHWAKCQLNPHHANEAPAAFDSEPWDRFTTPWQLISIVRQLLNRYFPSSRAIKEEDAGALMGLFVRAYIKARKAACPTLDTHALGVQFLGEFTSCLPEGERSSDRRHRIRRDNRFFAVVPTRLSHFYRLFSDEPSNLRDWEEKRLYDLLDSPVYERSYTSHSMSELIGLLDRTDIERSAADLFGRKVVDPMAHPNLIERRDEFIAIAKGCLNRSAQPPWHRQEALRDSFIFALGLDEKPLFRARL